jgi:flagellar protein FliL
VKKILIALVGLGVLGGGGAGAYFMLFKQSAQAALPPATQEHAQAEADHGAKEGEHGAAKSEPTFVKLDPLVVPVMDSEGAAQVISLMISLEVKDAAASEKVTALQPRIKDAFIQDLYGVVNNPAAMEKGVLNVGYVKKRLQSVSAKVMGEGVVNDVLLQMVQQSPL